MRTIELFRLRRSPDRAGALAVMAAHAQLAPGEARAVLHAALAGERPCLMLSADATARACIEALAPLGFVARFAPAADFDVAERAQEALALVLPQMPRAVTDAAGALLLQSQWLAALDHVLQHLCVHAPEHDARRALLARTAIEVGLVAGLHARA